MGPIQEQRALKLSLTITAATGLIAFAAGLLMGSRAITFDGMYSFVDVILTIGALVVSRLLVREPSRRFQYGYWHLEPLAGAIESAILVTACFYAAINAVQGLLGGGHAVAYGPGMVWAGIMFIIGIVMAIYMRRLARRQKSILLEVDYRSWLLGGFLSLALLVAYAIAVLLGRHGYHRWVPYVDPAVLLFMSLALLPMPLKTLLLTVRHVLEVAPEDLDQRVRGVMDEVIREHGFLSYTSHVAQVGRGRFVEIHILVPADWHIESVTAVDDIRHEIARRLDATWPKTWLTIDFTADPAWM